VPSRGPFGPSLTGLFEATWRPRKAVTVLWRRVETLSPDAYAELLAWVRSHAAGDERFPWLEAMATNEVAIDAAGAIAEIDRVLQRRPPEPIAASARLLRDLIWEAIDANSDWLTWRPCRICGRRWATAPLQGIALCPEHHHPAVLIDYLRAEMAAFDGLVDHSAVIARLERDVEAPAPRPPALPPAAPVQNGAGASPAVLDRGPLGLAGASDDDHTAETLAGDDADERALLPQSGVVDAQPRRG
jgi:hypothetical protein